LSATRQIVLSEKRIGLETETRFAMEEYIGTLASVYHKSPQQFIRGSFKPKTLEPSPALRVEQPSSLPGIERWWLSRNSLTDDRAPDVDGEDGFSPVSTAFVGRGMEDLI